MPKNVLAAFICLLAAAAFGQWSEPVTLAESISPYGSGPELAPTRGDTVWALWIHEGTPPGDQLMARFFTADTWHGRELPAVGSEGLYWPAGIADDSGRMLVAYYDGSYPVKSPTDQDSWGVYTTTRTDTGWSRPALAHGMLAQAFPTYVRLGKARDGSVGMIWDESCGGINAMESVMVSRRTPSGWTPRRCIAPGRYPDIYCHCGSLVSGDSTDFCVTFSRRPYPGTSEVEVWDMNDSLVQAPAVFSGALPMLARGQTSRFLVLTRGDTLLGAENRGEGWSDPLSITADIGWGGATLCTDHVGWGWVCWPDGAQQSVLASYNRGAGWSHPETVATSSALGAPRIASDALGNLHCVWFDHSGGGSGQLRHARRLARPGVEETSNAEARTTKLGPAIVRGILCLPASPFTIHSSLFDHAGRKVMALLQGANDVSGLSPGVYFVREYSAFSTQHSGPSAVSCRRVVILR